jgi:hypothetical protein
MAWEYDETVRQLFVDFKKAYDSVRMEVLYSILIRVRGYRCRVPGYDSQRYQIL